MPADYTGDGAPEMAVFRPNGQWFVYGQSPESFGTTGDIPVPGDYNGDGTTDIALFRPSLGVWFVRDGATAGLGHQR